MFVSCVRLFVREGGAVQALRGIVRRTDHAILRQPAQFGLGHVIGLTSLYADQYSEMQKFKSAAVLR
jgi:hypothetical protein